MVDLLPSCSTESEILDQYHFGDVLGQGSFGLVRGATYKQTGHEIAVKLIDKHNLDIEEENSLDLEVDIINQVDHPNIVKTYGIVDAPRKLYILMEKMTGGELFDRIVEKDHYSEAEAAKTMIPIIDAIKYCHSMGIVHRDLKPENLLYTSPDPDAIIKVSDFGLARFYDDDVMTTACGTPGYVAPEILHGKGYGLEVDYWSIGVILYIILCGFPPFYEESNQALFETIKSGSFEFPSPFWDGISDMAKEVVSNCLKVDPKERYTADQILSHPWLSGSAPTDEMPYILEELKQFNAKRRFKKVANVAVAAHRFKKAGSQAQESNDS